MKLLNSALGLTINIEDELIEYLKIRAKEYYPKEFGGLLIGRYSEDNLTLNITNTILPKKFKSSSFEFIRETEDLRETINKLFLQTPSKIYVGEWHTHPDGVSIPSRTDLKALKEIVQHEEVFIDNPILLIVSVSKQNFDLGFYVYFNNKVYRYENN